jgi:hypothetical protein
MKKKDFQSIADRLAKQRLWDRAAYVGEWNNFAVYRSKLDGDGLRCIGFPYYFLFDVGGNYHIADETEWRGITDALHKEIDAISGVQHPI